MENKTFIFFGPSGSGKGTQANLLLQRLKSIDEKPVLYIETGRKFREFAEEASLTARSVENIMASGGLLPEFLPIWIWSEYLIRHVSGNEHMILDGLARRAHEAPILDSAMKFYKREKPFVISIEVSRDWAKDRLIARGRGDDNIKDIEKRLDWYYENVLQAISFFKDNKDYTFLTINGEQTIEKVFDEIVEKTSL